MKRMTKKEAKKMFEWIDKIDEHYYRAVDIIEKEVKRFYGEDLEFIWVDGSIVGIGNEDRSMKLIHRE